MVALSFFVYLDILKMLLIDKDYFSISETLYCGQVFRFSCINSGEPFFCPIDCDYFKKTDNDKVTCAFDVFLVRSLDKTCWCFDAGDKNVLVCKDEQYFLNYFDLNNDYKDICDKVISKSKECGFKNNLFPAAVEFGKGIRILNQSPWEALISFIVSQNNNIPRIKGIINRLCSSFGKQTSDGGFAFPEAEALAASELSELKKIGLGYRDSYILDTAKKVRDGYQILDVFNKNTDDAIAYLRTLKGVGGKVADCILLFGYHRTDSFPVDVWIDRAYHEMGGTEVDRNKIRAELVGIFKEYSGYAQQYLFNFFFHNFSPSA